MQQNETLTKIKDVTGNPAPLGLLGFGMTTVLLNVANAGYYSLNTMVLGMGLCYGGIAQLSPVFRNGKRAIPLALLPLLLTASSGCHW